MIKIFSDFQFGNVVSNSKQMQNNDKSSEKSNYKFNRQASFKNATPFKIVIEEHSDIDEENMKYLNSHHKYLSY